MGSRPYLRLVMMMPASTQLSRGSAPTASAEKKIITHRPASSSVLLLQHPRPQADLPNLPDILVDRSIWQAQALLLLVDAQQFNYSARSASADSLHPSGAHAQSATVGPSRGHLAPPAGPGHLLSVDVTHGVLVEFSCT